jgi:hypothetical protein
MSDSFRRTPVPAWKNSPLKTVPDGFKKVTINNRPKVPLQSKRLQNVSITSEDMRKMLRDVPNMFDDDEDNNAAESGVGDDEEASAGGANDPVEMALMFASPDASMLHKDSTEAIEVYSNGEEQEESSVGNTEAAGVVPDTLRSGANIRLLLQSAAEQAAQLHLDQERETIDIAAVLQEHPELLDSVRFLARFEEEFESKHVGGDPLSGRRTASAEGENQYEERILHKLDSYVKLPAGALYTMVLRQHEEIVDTGLFGAGQF